MCGSSHPGESSYATVTPRLHARHVTASETARNGLAGGTRTQGTEYPLYSSCRPLSTERAGTTLAETVTRTQVWVGGSPRPGLARTESSPLKPPRDAPRGPQSRDRRGQSTVQRHEHLDMDMRLRGPIGATTTNDDYSAPDRVHGRSGRHSAPCTTPCSPRKADHLESDTGRSGDRPIFMWYAMQGYGCQVYSANRRR